MEKSDKEQIKATHRKESREWISGRFRMEEFRVPILKGVIQPPTEPLINIEDVTLDLNVQYLAGGGAGFLPVKLRGEIKPKYIQLHGRV